MKVMCTACVSVMWNGEPRCGGVIRYELWCDVKCDVYVKCDAMWNVAISARHGAMWNVAEM